MFIGAVIGAVVASHKTANMEGLSLRLVRKLKPDGEPRDVYTVAVDVIGASEGEIVLVATGSTARQTHLTDARPCDAVIMAVVDTWQIADVVKYTKTDSVLPSA